VLSPLTGPLDRLRGAVAVLYREMIKFGVVGAVAFVIDLGGANLLWHTVLTDKVTTAKIISGAVATAFAWLGNRQWTFRHRRSRPVHHEVALFFLVNGIALAISAVVLAFSHYGLDFTSRLADNLASVVGIGIGTLFRFWAYRRFVFAGEPIAPESEHLLPG
jgi:putative flippase GtrA